MTDAEWQVIRAVLPVPAWLEGRGGRPESYCHRVMLDAVRYVVDTASSGSICLRISRRTGVCTLSPAAGR
ncbi:transposase [Streptomyces sp. NPDC002870]|uniref:transposase n=1 Tax=Streptomyces sp. NPDC002870 TaxID=3364666 RepID=UPI0036905248